ncbi:YihY/virulence factor BrkB family protein [Roseomonas harenae]|uniref:YihY/virulence factor BrkB family protein n=1 Tax=Muricoccus harenae TaxID=2692566 RepID=UPI001F3E3B54|nr:YihY/virulence factor BrkB family protein [Roseomonas harenae]
MKARNRWPSPLLAAIIASISLMIIGFRQQEAPMRPAHGVAKGAIAVGQSRRTPSRRSGKDRGQSADTPSEIPARGWWDILRRTFQQVSEDRLLTEAAGITFYVLLALFPALSALVSLYGLFANPDDITSHLAALSGVVPGGGMQIIEEQVKRVAAQSGGSLGFGLVIGLAVSLWSANGATKAAFDTLNLIYEEHEERSFLKRTAITLAFTLGAILFALLAIAAVVAVPVALSFVGFGPTVELVLRVLRWPLMLVAVAVLLAFLFRYGPSRDKAKWRWISWGSAFAAIAWLLGSAAFSFYVSNFGSYNETYGSLGAVIGFMTWIWISSTIILVAAELDAEMERQTEKDTTVGSEQPIGTRGARMADTVAPAEP